MGAQIAMTYWTCVLVLRLASRLVPREFRRTWLQRHRADLADWRELVERGDIPAGAGAAVGYTARAVVRTVRQFADWPRLSRSAGLGLAVPAAMLLVVIVASGGMRGLRLCLSPLPYPDAGQLVQFRAFIPFHGVRIPVPEHTVDAWRKESQTVERFGGFRLTSGSVAVTPEFFSTLGAVPKGAAAPFWLRPRRVSVFNPGPRDETVLVARLKTGVEPLRAEAELRAISWRMVKRPALDASQGQRIQLVRVTDALRQPLVSAGWGLAIAAGVYALGLVIAALRKRRPARYWGFTAAQASLVMLAFSAAWLEIFSARALPVNEPSLSLILMWTFLLAFAGGLWMTVRDLRRRCPECLRRLSMPVSIGSWSSPLIDPVGTELLCEQGHGTLYVPETLSSDRAPEAWMPLSAGWRDL